MCGQGLTLKNVPLTAIHQKISPPKAGGMKRVIGMTTLIVGYADAESNNAETMRRYVSAYGMPIGPVI